MQPFWLNHRQTPQMVTPQICHDRLREAAHIIIMFWRLGDYESFDHTLYCLQTKLLLVTICCLRSECSFWMWWLWKINEQQHHHCVRTAVMKIHIGVDWKMNEQSTSSAHWYSDIVRAVMYNLQSAMRKDRWYSLYVILAFNLFSFWSLFTAIIYLLNINFLKLGPHATGSFQACI